VKVAFVVPRYGVEVVGGAERLCRAVAERMAGHWRVEVVTTCALDYMTWRDEFPPGPALVNGIPVHRFAVDEPRDVARFDALSAGLYTGRRDVEAERRWMRAQGPCSSTLLGFLEDRARDYDWFVYVPYLYATTYHGLRLTGDRSVLVPAAHDEPPLVLGIFREVFARSRALVFSTPEEQALINARFDVRDTPQDVIGVGIDPPLESSADRFRRTWGRRLDGCPFILYVGRIDPSKGCGHLFEYFARYRVQRPEPRLKLVLVGSAAMDIPGHPDLVPLGVLEEADKVDALAAARVVVVPSPYESLSLVALEAWAASRPVLANGVSDVLRGQCARSNGGLWYGSYAEFREALSLLLERPGLAEALGRAGQAFVAATCAWPVVEDRYRALFERLTAEPL
jgi:glycosyltransferase involved in cell wall biosynthesis